MPTDTPRALTLGEKSRINILGENELEKVFTPGRDGRVVNARALRARGSQGPHGFESHSRRHKKNLRCPVNTNLPLESSWKNLKGLCSD